MTLYEQMAEILRVAARQLRERGQVGVSTAPSALTMLEALRIGAGAKDHRDRTTLPAGVELVYVVTLGVLCMEFGLDVGRMGTHPDLPAVMDRVAARLARY